jgi:hypothetical protein
VIANTVLVLGQENAAPLARTIEPVLDPKTGPETNVKKRAAYPPIGDNVGFAAV